MSSNPTLPSPVERGLQSSATAKGRVIFLKTKSLPTPTLPSPCRARLAIQSTSQGEGGFLEEEGGEAEGLLTTITASGVARNLCTIPSRSAERQAAVGLRKAPAGIIPSREEGVSG